MTDPIERASAAMCDPCQLTFLSPELRPDEDPAVVPAYLDRWQPDPALSHAD